jgi:hypothetical protein
MQLKGFKSKMTREPTWRKGRLNQTEVGLCGSAQGGRHTYFWCRFGSPFLEHEDDATRKGIHKEERLDGREIILEEDQSSLRTRPQVEEDVKALPRHPRRRRKTPSEASP